MSLVLELVTVAVLGFFGGWLAAKVVEWLTDRSGLAGWRLTLGLPLRQRLAAMLDTHSQLLHRIRVFYQPDGERFRPLRRHRHVGVDGVVSSATAASAAQHAPADQPANGRLSGIEAQRVRPLRLEVDQLGLHFIWQPMQEGYASAESAKAPEPHREGAASRCQCCGKPFEQLNVHDADRSPACGGVAMNAHLSPAKPRLSTLAEPHAEISALLLQSIAGTHADVLSFDQIDESYQLGIRTVSGTFTHLPSQQRYIVAVCLVPATSDGRECAADTLEG